jgi:hypothetical protein
VLEFKETKVLYESNTLLLVTESFEMGQNRLSHKIAYFLAKSLTQAHRNFVAGFHEVDFDTIGIHDENKIFFVTEGMFSIHGFVTVFPFFGTVKVVPDIRVKGAKVSHFDSPVWKATRSPSTPTV